MTGVERIAATFARCRAERRAALIPFLAAGDPDFATTFALARAAADAGADIIELGVPFSDPLADGPVIQAAYARALQGGASTRLALRCAAGVAEQTDRPVVLMVALNQVLSFGMDPFIEDAAGAGVAGVIVPDLPLEDADELRAVAARVGLATVFLAAPDTPAARLADIVRASTGFVYMVRRRGVTGIGLTEDDLPARVAAARATSTVPIAAGFGVTTAADAADVARVADGVIVGSALIRAAGEAMLRARSGGGQDPGARTQAGVGAVDTLMRELAAAVRRTDDEREAEDGPEDGAGTEVEL